MRACRLLAGSARRSARARSARRSVAASPHPSECGLTSVSNGFVVFQGRYRASVDASTSCAQCAANSENYGLGNVLPTSCVCSAGATGNNGGLCCLPHASNSTPGPTQYVLTVMWFAIQTGPCNLCVAGTYKNSPGSESCSVCPASSTSLAGSTSVSQCLW